MTAPENNSGWRFTMKLSAWLSFVGTLSVLACIAWCLVTCSLSALKPCLTEECHGVLLTLQRGGNWVMQFVLYYGTTLLLPGLILALVISKRRPFPAERGEQALQTERLDTGERCVLRELTVLVEGVEHSVNEGFETDFSSIPTITPVVHWSKVDIAGVVHDKHYADPKIAISRAESDWVWAVIAMAGKHRANAYQAGLCWVTLRILGGIFAWKKRTLK